MKLDRPFLHAAKLVFKHPSDGRRMEFESELPLDLKSVLDELIASNPEDLEQSIGVSGQEPVREGTVAIVYKGRVFSVEVERRRFPNGPGARSRHRPAPTVRRARPDSGRWARDSDSAIPG